MKKVIVTGGAGFIGSHLTTNLIENGYKVVIIDNFNTGKLSNINHIKKNKYLSIFKADIRDKKKISKLFKNVDFVFHLAAIAEIVPSIENPEEYFTTNVNGTLNILELAKEYGIKKIIYAASSSCYGLPSKFPTDELQKIDTQYPYALTKYIAEELLIHWSNVYGINFVSLRLFNVYGPRSRTSGTYGAVFGVFLAQKLAKKPLTIVGNGKQKRDFVYVDDVVQAFIKSTNLRIKNQIFNIGSGNTYSINYLVNLLGGKKTFIKKRPGEPDCTFADISKAKKMLKWNPKITLKIGVNKLLNNISYWQDAPIWDKKSINKATKSWFKYLK